MVTGIRNDILWRASQPTQLRWGSLNTRIPRGLRRALKVHVVEIGVSSQDFIIDALREKLQRGGKRNGARRAS